MAFSSLVLAHGSRSEVLSALSPVQSAATPVEGCESVPHLKNRFFARDTRTLERQSVVFAHSDNHSSILQEGQRERQHLGIIHSFCRVPNLRYPEVCRSDRPSG